jgi:predicted transport protein
MVRRRCWQPADTASAGGRRRKMSTVAQTPADMMSTVSASLTARTGRALAEWVALVQASGIDPVDQNAVRRWLKAEHGVPQNSQWAIADAAARAAGWTEPSLAGYVDSQYRGAKAGLRPIYDALAAAILSLGGDVTAEGRSTYVPFTRGRQFAAVAAAARDRVDLGLRLPSPPACGRLVPASAPGQATHKVPLRSVADVDDELAGLLRAAYEQNG